MVGGALSDRSGSSELAQLLASQFTVFSYDRRGRGDSTDTKPYSVRREIEDIEALIDSAGGSAYVYGKSSGASLALQAAAALGEKVKKLALYEPPYNDAEGAAKEWKEFKGQARRSPGRRPSSRCHRTVHEVRRRAGRGRGKDESVACVAGHAGDGADARVRQRRRG